MNEMPESIRKIKEYEERLPQLILTPLTKCDNCIGRDLGLCEHCTLNNYLKYRREGKI